MVKASPLAVIKSEDSSSNVAVEVLLSLLVITEAKNSTAPADSMQRLFASLSDANDFSVCRDWSCRDGLFASLMSFRIWILLMGGLGVGILSMALRMHHDWIRRRRV